MKLGKTNGIIVILLIVNYVLLIISCKKDEHSNVIADIDGNHYHAVTIGSQVWMVENLRVTKYRNGDPIPNVTVNSSWGGAGLKIGAYSNYYSNKQDSIYGKLYNWYAVNDSRKIAPVGWHVPTDDDWSKLALYLGGDSVAGGKLKEEGISNWQSPNWGATNESGFYALPGGYRDSQGIGGIGRFGYWWSSTEQIEFGKRGRFMGYDNWMIYKYGYGGFQGFSVRCIRD